ncbi:MAG: hypothetical protein A2W93_00420 [Bacteroidetes bacterium GWF2_43_63]|nr:MAG: hypothetical protein A2W94_13100 [Bacteroidetes bacterium GWE2_42_42]OFY53869.1 MAG: hypothetical protein A2W93_00420 [Bacteroidetes bacterium GWF2_43_63]HBG69828.1 hypothetical protein [Bacteroidales bacterium]HCB60975.1 hypothetical protein [Bacteroidales bacterium]HCY24531.1 hypothetical protein [Bacteroidales bacterium]
MKLPFTTEQFFNVIEKYNLTMFPFQLIIFMMGIGCLFLLHSKLSAKDKLIGICLGTLWIWIGVAYHLAFFTVINKAAYLFGVLFILQGLFILLSTFGKNRLIFKFTLQTKDYLGYFFILYGLIVYPIISYFVEGSIERTIVMGLPCPSTIFTFGFFILAGNKFTRYLLIIPSLWAIVGLSAAINIGVFQDVMIIIAAITADIILILRKKE